MSPVPAPNLLPRTRALSRQRENAIRVWVGTFIASVLLIAIPASMLSLHLRSAKPADTEHVQRFVADLAELQSTLPPLKKELVLLEVASISQKRAQTRIQWTSVLDQLARTTSEEVRINSFNATVENSTTKQRIVLTIQTHTKSLTQAREFLFVLERTGLFDEVTMLDSRRQSSSEDSKVNSIIRASIVAEKPAEEKP